MAVGNSALVIDSEGGSPSATMRAQARRLSAMAEELNSLADCIDDQAGYERQSADMRDESAQLAAAREAYRERRARSKVFEDPALFGEPGWDLLLDLYIAALEGKRVPVTSACIGAAVPTTTALRWIAMLEAKGLIARENDSSDARRVFVKLAPEARQGMADYFARITKAQRAEPNAASRAVVNGAEVRPFMLRNGSA